MMMRKFVAILGLVFAVYTVLSAKEYRGKNGMPGKGYWQNYPSYMIEADFDNQKDVVNGIEHISYTNNSPHKLDSIVFNLYKNVEGLSTFAIKTVKTGKKELDYRIDNTKMIVYLKKSLRHGKTLDISVDWSFKIGKGDERSGKYAKGYFIGYWYPQIAVFDDDGWDTVQHSGTEEFYFEYAKYDVKITTHDNFYIYATSPAIQMPDYKENKNNVWHFKSIETFDFAFVASNSMSINKISSDDAGGVGADIILISDNATFRSRAAEYSKSFINLTSTISAPKLKFPFSQLVLFDNRGRNGGMEFPGMVNLGISGMGPGTTNFVVQHELGHEYAPFLAGFNQARQAFMDEGFASFIPYLAKDLDELRKERKYVSLCFMDFAVTTGVLSDFTSYPKYPLFTESYKYKSFNDYQAMSYNKSFVALTMLREVLGKDGMDKLIHNFFEAWAYKHPKAEDFLNAARVAYGDDLEWFIQPWYYSEKKPDLSVKRSDTKPNVVEVTNVGGVPVPIQLIVCNKEGEDDCGFKVKNGQYFYMGPDVWKDKTTVEIEYEPMTSKYAIVLGSDEVPDEKYDAVIMVDGAE